MEAERQREQALIAAQRARQSAKDSLDKANLALDNAASAERLAEQDEKEATRLTESVLKAGPRSWLLNGRNRTKMIAALLPFAGQKADVRYCSYEIPGAPFGVDREVISLVLSIRGLLVYNANWVSGPAAGDRKDCGGTGVAISFHPEAPDSTKRAARKLSGKLTEFGIAGMVYPIVPTPRPPGPNTYIDNGIRYEVKPLGEDTIIIDINGHP